MSTHPTVTKWLRSSRSELDDIYRNAKVGTLPNGDTAGTAIIWWLGFLATPLALLFRLLVWQGKVVDIFAPACEAGVLVNKVTPLRLKFIVAKVCRGNSWMDGKDTIIIDYSATSFFFRAVRDEIREVEAGVWLGKVWLGKLRVADFALVARR